MNKFIIVFILLSFDLCLFSQNINNLPAAKEFQKSYSAQTRSLNGNPGLKYWQNHASYIIEAELFPDTRTIVGSQLIDYINYSPDSLDKLVFNIYQDIFKKGTARDWDIGAADLHDGVLIWDFYIDGLSVDLNSNQVQRYASIMTVDLTKKLAPNSKVKIEMKWKFQLPLKRTIRMGTYQDSNFMVAYWFPRLAVYDDIVGWNNVPYVGNCEFYNDFSNFDVSITTPQNYLVWASSPLANASEIYSNLVLNRLNRANLSDSIIPILTSKDYSDNSIFKTNGKHVWKFKMDHIVDFAFAASNNYLWDATSIVSGNQRVAINAVYKHDSKDFFLVANISRNVIDYFTNQTPEIPFPFPQMTAFNGRGGMEYPGMVNDGDNENLNGTLYLTAHEIGHSYFPFYTGLNEQRYAWMDEGLITYFPRKFVAKYSPDSAYLPFSDLVQSYNRLAASFAEIPLMLPSIYTGNTYRFQAYTKAAIAFMELEKYLGTDTFNRGLQEFSRRWNGKHPIPYDLFFTFNEVANEDLSWFWNPWFFEMSYADLAINVIDNNTIALVNVGGNPVNISLNIVYKNGKIEQRVFKASVWKNGIDSISLNLDLKQISSLTLDSNATPDAFPANNFWTSK